MITAFLHRRINIFPLLISWTISFFGNLAGSLFFMALITGYGGVFSEAPAYTQAAIRLSHQKCVQPAWHQIFLRAIGANWLVCFAVFSSIQAREVVSKIVAIWWPTATFVALALDHTIANMFFIPMGIWVGAEISVGYYIWKSMIASAIGNIVGGGLFVGTAYWYLYLTGEARVSVSFDLGAEASAVQAGAGPLRPTRSSEPMVVDGVAPEEARGAGSEYASPRSPVRSEATQLMSGIAKELSDDSEWAKTHEERTRPGKNETPDSATRLRQNGNSDEKV